MNAADVTLAILNYNGRRFLEMMLPTVFAQTATGFRVHVIDDASSDDSVAYLRESWPQVQVLRNERNLGITASMSRAALSADTEFVAVLNNDLELDPRWLEELLAALRAHPLAAAVDSKMLDHADRRTIDGVGDVLSRAGYPRRRGQGEPDRGQYDEPAEVFSASGAAALYRRAAFDDVGPYDAGLHAYYEDVDWGFRARLHGWTFWTAPRAIAYHVGSGTAGAQSQRYAPLIVRNQVLVMLKNFPLALLLARLPRIVGFQLKWLAFDAMHGLGRAHVAGLAGVVRAVPALARARREVQGRRRVSWREIARVTA